MVMEVRPEQLAKAPHPILVTELGIVIEVRLLHLSKAQLSMLVTELGIVVFLHPAINMLDCVSMIALQSFLLSYF
jgi:hypothetical protein